MTFSKYVKVIELDWEFEQPPVISLSKQSLQLKTTNKANYRNLKSIPQKIPAKNTCRKTNFYKSAINVDISWILAISQCYLEKLQQQKI